LIIKIFNDMAGSISKNLLLNKNRDKTNPDMISLPKSLVRGSATGFEFNKLFSVLSNK